MFKKILWRIIFKYIRREFGIYGLIFKYECNWIKLWIGFFEKRNLIKGMDFIWGVKFMMSV